MRSIHRAGSRSSRRHSAGRRSLRSRSACRSRSAFTLLEVMIATAVTLLMMISLVQVFKVIGDSMKQGRAALQMNNSLRSVTTRLRQDLGNLTVRVDPPSDTSSGGGYFEYFDGSMTDYSAALFASDAPLSNRFGDTDDILMFTARAGSSWFTGQVPTKVVNGVTGQPIDDVPVVITSQLAEIAVFARPVSSPGGRVPFDDEDSNGFPDSFRLHYRVLLIRPDLNTIGTTAVRALPGMSVSSNNDFPNTMADFFGICDLSMRRVYDGNGSNNDLIAANSLEDLANPANRFAHFQYSLVGLGTNGTCTMPLLVLDPITNVVAPPNTALIVNSVGPYSDPNPATSPVLGANGNYLSSAYVLDGDRTGEDVIANNILAFDVKGFDPGAPIIAAAGQDGVFGVTGTAGQDGSDDVILSPNDPGYAAAFNTAITPVVQVVSYGDYVDLMWGRKVLHSLSGNGLTYANISGNTRLNLSTALSGLDGTLGFSDGLLRSGKAVTVSNRLILQPTYDTWTTAFESNGTSQAPLSSGNGVVDVNAFVRKNGGGSNDSQGTVDSGTDGIDNNSGGGVDETAERETLPPFPIKLRGIKVSVRIEDLNTRQIKQMSVATEFATQ